MPTTWTTLDLRPDLADLQHRFHLPPPTIQTNQNSTTTPAFATAPTTDHARIHAITLPHSLLNPPPDLNANIPPFAASPPQQSPSSTPQTALFNESDVPAMKETMDGAANNAYEVAQHILPERPHHLSLSFDRRFPAPPAWWFTGASGALQYMTYISAAQRGILTTRASFEICEEPPAPMPAQVLAKGEAKKKLSLLDYQNRKKSASPIENGTQVKTEPKTEPKTNGSTVYAKPLAQKDGVKKEDVKATDKPSNPQRQADTRPEKPRPATNGERYVELVGGRNGWASLNADDAIYRSKASQPTPQPDSDRRKRAAADMDPNPSPQKRVKADPGATASDRSRPPRPLTPRGRDDKPLRDAKSESLYPTINGLPPSYSERDRENTSSPRSTIQVNGSRPRSDSGTSTPRKAETTTKSALPQLLSPLHPSLFEGETEKRATPKKKPLGAPISSKFEKERAKKPPRIPALLSPTLPPVVEEMLALKDRKQTASKAVPSQQSTSDSSNGARKTTVATAPSIRMGHDDEKPSRPTLLVTLKLKKPTAKRAKDLLSLPSKSVKEALRRDRSTSADIVAPPAQKRPRAVDDTPQETGTAGKRNKTTADAITAKPAGPTTPLKPAATAMSRVASTQSQGNTGTPAATTGLTPGMSDNRPPTRSEPLDPKTLAQVEAFKELHAEHERLGGKLKHARDDLYRERGPSLAPADERRGTALHFEMVLAYMVAFHWLNQARLLERKVFEVNGWETLLPHLAQLRSHVQGNRALKALAVQMHVLCLEQITNAFGTLDPGSAASIFNRWAKHNRTRAIMWGEANTMWERVEDPRMRMAVGPWTTVDEAVGAALGIMRRWAEREGVKWQPEVAVKGDKDRERDREPQRDRDRERDRERERDRDVRERDPRDRERDRDRERERARDRDRDRDRDRPRPALNGGRY